MNAPIQWRPSGKHALESNLSGHLLVEPAKAKLLKWSERQIVLTLPGRGASFSHPSIVREWGINE